MKEINLKDLTFKDLEVALELINKNRIVFKTGEYGMLLFNRLIDSELNKHSFKKIITSIASNIDCPQKIDELQFVEYKLVLGLEVRIEHDISLDIENKDKDTGFSISNTILYLQ